MSGRLIVLTLDLPYPPNYGHKVDQFNRWKGFAERGWKIRLICWRSPQDPPMAPEDIQSLSNIFESIEILPIGYDVLSLAKRFTLLSRYPSHVASRIPTFGSRRRIRAEATAFRPDAVILDGIYGGVFGEELARTCQVPLIIRGHNIEHQYFAAQARAVRSAKSKLKWTIARFGLERYETALIRRAAWTFDISADDVRYWQARGIEHISWAPTVYSGKRHGTILPETERLFDVAYIGNMRLPNNLAGLAWFVDEILPILHEHRPDIRYCFAGANPSTEALAIFARAPQITLVPNAPDADTILANGRVLINPILSGSGVNVKSIDMLRYDAPIVTTSIGAQGFGSEIEGQFIVRDDASGFATAILVALADPHPPIGRDDIRRLFSEEGLNSQIALVEKLAVVADHG